MMDRRTIINGMAGACWGALLTHLGVGMTDYLFWVGIFLMAVFVANNLE